MSLSFIQSYESFVSINYGNFLMADRLTEHVRKCYPGFPIDKGLVTFDHIENKWNFAKFTEDEKRFLLLVIKKEFGS